MIARAVQRGFFLTLCCFVLLCTDASRTQGGDIPGEKIQKAYEDIKDITGEFVQKSHIKDLKRTDTFKGTFVIKMPSQMKWQYFDEKKRHFTEVLIAHDELLIYQKEEKQVFKGKFDSESYGQAPIALLTGFAHIDREFTVAEKNGKLLLKPRKGMGSVVSIEITPSDGEFPIDSLTIIDRRSNTISITLKDVRINSGVKEAAFSFSLPQGVSVYQYRPQ
ncbi:MAG TPA: outer membrane lipoprotein carrier protein LolA [Thermodesulfovibrionales bacterium]|nr:outer membrane lipoprotein carrier protein LolA [Thermodesulfovibrionales bacterium]